MKFTKAEIEDLLKSIILVSIALSLFLKGDFFTLIGLSIVTLGLGFVLHELGHKFVAQYFGFKAHYKAFLSALIVSVFMAWLGLFFIAPGAVFISGHIGRRENGIISAAGPGVNMILAIIFLFLHFIGEIKIGGFEVFMFGFFVNAFLALFNMIPAANFDGKKILGWNKVIYGIMVGISLIMVVGYYML